MLNLLGSHDMARFLTLARGDNSALKMATLFQMIYPGAPSIYYGDEIGMTGGHDPANRGAFPWHNPDTLGPGLVALLSAADRPAAQRKRYGGGRFSFSGRPTAFRPWRVSLMVRP